MTGSEEKEGSGRSAQRFEIPFNKYHRPLAI